MKREYRIVIEAKGSHQPSQDEIMAAIVRLVDNRVREYPKPTADRRINIVPVRNL